MSIVRSFRRLPRVVRERQMLDAAVETFSRQGYHATAMDEIAERAGISKPMLYAYLGTKEQLFVACLHREAARMLEAVVAAADVDLTGDEQLWRGLRAFFGFVGAHRDGWVVLYRQARAEQRFAGELATLRTAMVQAIAGLLARAVDGFRPIGRPVTAVDLEVMAYALVGAIESLADWLADHPDVDPDTTAARMMNVAWLGAAQLLTGQTWRAADQPS
ncbi:TetR/AcrR family transcriptional regulator [Micromonospora sp. NBC_01813]|uniref:TetR/AcrR family transcriptional regulator n=1 Tax=Micromonospora sp. NBC_01813 TaxID=2975988 RepID=UPI002DDC61AF|nr:TetR/AcrR family transcriptional regulator [Micromonospora sp. NBC_01813]WSA07338.1 TetR/AcrR family transcriptional regulator [Micromonospora sp. NBC_01813]